MPKGKVTMSPTIPLPELAATPTMKLAVEIATRAAKRADCYRRHPRDECGRQAAMAEYWRWIDTRTLTGAKPQGE
jgi:hypothetical protein